MATTRSTAPIAALIAVLSTCCGKSPEPPAAPDPGIEAAPVASNPDLVGNRPYLLGPAPDASPAEPAPLFVVLHGYGAPSESLVESLGIVSRARSRGFVYAVPDGTEDPRGLRFWNASTACCNFFDSEVDDVAYVAAVIEDAVKRRNVDPNRVYVVGHSNGGFMGLRLACELSDRIAGVASIAGAGGESAKSCKPSSPVAVLQIHGDQDWHVPFGGGRVLRRESGGTHPSAAETVARWGRLNGCDSQPARVGERDLEAAIPGDETIVERYTGCQGGAAELWSVRGGDHFVAQSRRGFDAIYEFLMAHPGKAAKR